MQSVFVYTREAHPGEHLPAHRTWSDKVAAAAGFRDRWTVRRPILVDDLEGTMHRAYGLLPNMAFVVSRGGRLIYKANWTDATHLELVVERVLTEGAASDGRPRRRQLPFHVEWVPKRERDDDAFLSGLLAAGPRAVEEFISAIAAVSGEPSARAYRQWWAARQEES